jgi:hypothetical protein
MCCYCVANAQAQAQPAPSEHEVFVDSVFDSLDEVKEVMLQIEKNLTKCVKISNRLAKKA